MGPGDGGRTWHDLIPAVFVSGSYGAGHPPHLYSRRFTATRPWHVTLNNVTVDNNASCLAGSQITIYVRTTRNQSVAAPIHGSPNSELHSTPEHVTGKLRLDVASRCSSFSVRVDGVR